MYKIEFEFRNEATGYAWTNDFLDNNGAGFSLETAKSIAADFNRRENIKNAVIVEMEG